MAPLEADKEVEGLERLHRLQARWRPNGLSLGVNCGDVDLKRDDSMNRRIDDRARAARALIASLLRAGETEHVAESV